ncbi:MAG: hypothetical protein H7X99_08060 [Saprospiraceae bacterium]|nr:hypothetical protein [Saprospiraceae bacterium]
MKLLSQCFFLCFILVSSPLWGNDYYEGYLIKKSGERMDGMIEMFYGDDKNINFKDNEDGDKTKFKSIDLIEIGLYFPENSDTIVYKRYIPASYTWGKKPRIEKYEIWAFQIYNSDQVQGYYSPLVQVMHSRGSIRSWQMFLGFVKVKGQDYILKVVEQDEGYLDPFNVYDKEMRKSFSNAIKDICPDMVIKIKERKYKREEFLTMLSDYSETCK